MDELEKISRRALSRTNPDSWIYRYLPPSYKKWVDEAEADLQKAISIAAELDDITDKQAQEWDKLCAQNGRVIQERDEARAAVLKLRKWALQAQVYPINRREWMKDLGDTEHYDSTNNP